jgi:hypothetical protein
MYEIRLILKVTGVCLSAAATAKQPTASMHSPAKFGFAERPVVGTKYR